MLLGGFGLVLPDWWGWLVGGTSIGSFKGITFYPAPWVAGTRVVAYFGGVSHEVRFEVAKDVGVAIEVALNEIGDKTCLIGGNAVVSTELNIEILEGGGFRLLSLGTAAKLERL